jgi:hypothetical protein
MRWLSPWCDVADLAKAFERELSREIAPGHPLYSIPVEAIAKRSDSDDVLFQLLDGSHCVAVVHLTWTQAPLEGPPWPHTELFADLEAFADKRMQSDRRESIG